MSGPEPLADGLHPVPAGRTAAVVTHFERRGPPPDRLAAPWPGLRLRHVADPAPAPYRALFRRIGAPWLWSGRLALAEDALAALLADPAMEVHVAEEDRDAIGLVELDFREAGRCEITYFGLVPGRTGRGLGRWMMAEALHRAAARGVVQTWLHTCTLDDPRAPAFYGRCGFSAFRQEVEILPDPRGTGLLPPGAAPQVPRL